MAFSFRVKLYHNLFTFYNLVKSSNESEKAFCENQILDSKEFFVLRVDNEYLFAPVKYVTSQGRISNDMLSDEESQIISGILNDTFTLSTSNMFLNRKLVSFFRKFNIGSRLSPSCSFTFYFDDNNISQSSLCYFVNTTHVEGKKPFAWRQFVIKNLAAIGWNQVDYSDYSETEMVEHICLQNYRTESDALRSFRLIKKAQEGDLISAFNVNHSLFGVGIIASKYKFEAAIHNNGDVDKGKWYSHYLDVAWIITEEINSSTISFVDDVQWPVYDTLHVRNPIPSYIKTILLE